MKLTIKAVFLILLSLFTALAVPLALRFASSTSLKKSYAIAIPTPIYHTQGDPIGTPGGGGLPK